MTTEHQKPFVRIITPLFQAQQSVVDLFFKNRMSEEIEQVIDKHIQYQAHPSKESQHEYVRSLKDLDKVLQEITYLEKGNPIQLALSHEQVLRYLHGFLQEIQSIKQTSIETEGVTKTAEPAPRPLIHSAPVVQKRHLGKKDLSETQEKILEFVRQEQDCRTKDVVSQFSALSQRTIKRGLKELNKEGWIIKRLEGAAVYYSAV